MLLFLACFGVYGQTDSIRKVTGLFSEDSINQLNTLSTGLLDKSPDDAYHYSKQALEASQRNNFKRGTADAMANLGFYYQDQANYLTALDYFNNARLLYTEIGDTLQMARSLRFIGGLFRQRALYPEAEAYYVEALQMAQDRGYVSLIANSLKDLGGLAYEQQQYEKALDYFNQSLSQIDIKQDESNYAALLNNIGVVHKAAKNYQLSLNYLQQAYALLQKQQSVRDLSAVLMNIGEVHQHLGNFDEAERKYLQGLRAARRVKNIQRQVEANRYLAKFYASLEDYDKAYHYNERYTALKDTLYRQETSAQMAEMTKKLELERKERAFAQLIQDKELEILNKENKINRLELYRRNNLVLLSILMVLMIGVGAFILYKGYRSKRDQNQMLAAQNQEISLKNQQLQEMNEKLQSSEKQLKALNDTKDKFFGILAHDLRSPLVTLKGFVQILHQGHARFSQEEMNRLTGRIENSLWGITNLLDNLLQWSTAQTGVIEFAPRNVKLHRLIDENISLVEATAQVKDIALEKHLSPELVFADKQMLHLVIRNLLVNAIKFTPRGGTVKIVATETQDYTCILVQDTGVGMSPEKLKTLLEDNVLRTSRGTENEKGSGLGLWLCREFVERHRGTMEIDSEEGKGTIFKVVLPKALLPEPVMAS